MNDEFIGVAPRYNLERVCFVFPQELDVSQIVPISQRIYHYEVTEIRLNYATTIHTFRIRFKNLGR